MRRRILAGVQAGPAVVAQVGQVVHICLAKLQTARHGREDGAKTFAVAAGIADLHHACHFAFSGRQLLRRNNGNHLASAATSQCPGLLAQLFKRLHAHGLDLILHSAVFGVFSCRSQCSVAARNAAKGRTNRHAHASGIALAQHIARHHFARYK